MSHTVADVTCLGMRAGKSLLAVVLLLAVKNVALLRADASCSCEDCCSGFQLAGGLACALVLEERHTGLAWALVAYGATVAAVLVCTALAVRRTWTLALVACGDVALQGRCSQGSNGGHHERNEKQ